MCGIIHAKNLKDSQQVNDLVKIVYENQKDRGQAGFGFVGMNKNNIDIYRSTDESGIKNYLKSRDYDEILFHHRLPTSTGNVINSTHPFIIQHKNKKYYFIHNGVINNADELFKKHKKLNLIYQSLQAKGEFNDSESLAWEFILWLAGDKQKIEAQGSAAFICIEADRQSNRAKKLYFYHNDGSPLKVFRDESVLILSSLGNWAEVKQDTLYFYDYQDKQIKKHSKLKIDNPAVFNCAWWGDDDYYSEPPEYQLEFIKEEIKQLEQEKTTLVMQNRIEEAGEIDDYLEDLKQEQKMIQTYFKF